MQSRHWKKDCRHGCYIAKERKKRIRWFIPVQKQTQYWDQYLYYVLINGLDEWKGCHLGEFVGSTKLERIVRKWRLEEWADRDPRPVAR